MKDLDFLGGPLMVLIAFIQPNGETHSNSQTVCSDSKKCFCVYSLCDSWWGVVLLFSWFLCGLRELTLVVMTVGDTEALLTR